MRLMKRELTLEEKQARRKRLWGMNAYAAGDMLNGAIQLTSLYYLPFLILVVGMNPVIAGLVVAIGRVWDGISDPIMGAVSDRTRSKYGSCRPWFLIAAVPIFIGCVLLWSAWGIQGTAAQFCYFTFAYIFYTTAFTIGIVPYEALLPKMGGTYKERLSYTNLRPIYSVVVAVGVTYLYEALITATRDNPLSPAFQGRFTLLGVLLGALFCFPLIITFFGTKEPPITLPPPKPFKQEIKETLREYGRVLQNKTYRKYFAFVILTCMVSAAVLSSMTLLVYVIYGNIENYILGFTLLFLVVNLKGAVEIAFFIPNVVLTHKVSKHAPFILDLPLLAASGVIVLFMSAGTPVWLFLVSMCLLGAGTSCLKFVPMTLLPDLSDVHEVMYGRRSEGVNAGLNSLGSKISGGLTIALCGFVLGAFNLNSADLSYSNEGVSKGALTALKIMFSVLPTLACIGTVIIAKTYRLDKRRSDMLKNVLSEKREKGTVEISDADKIEIEKLTGKKFETLWIAKEGN